MLARLLFLTALICSPILLLPRGWWLSILPLGLVVLSLLATGLSKHFDGIYRLRYLEGRPDVAFERLKLWRLLLPRDQVVLLAAETLLQAERVPEVEKLRLDNGLPAWLRHHLGFLLARKRKAYEQAEECLLQILVSQPPAIQRVAAQAELARLLAEFFPDRVNEAESILDKAREGAPTGPMATLMVGVQGIVEVAGARPINGLAHLQEAAEQLGTTNVMVLPFVSEFHRWMGRAYAALDQPERAREELLTARTLTRLPGQIEACEADLAAFGV